jgi:hypothetical protein
MSEYPTKDDLKAIRHFHGTPREFIQLIERIWWPHGDSRINQLDLGPRGITHEWYIATGGWSGNEQVICVMDKTWFWVLYWQQSVRGGGYTFCIPDAHMDVQNDLGRFPSAGKRT